MRADTGADGIDALLGRPDRHLGAAARLTRDGANLDDPLLNLRHLQFKELFEQSRMRPREHNLRTAARALDLDDVGAHRVAVVVRLIRQLLCRHEHRLGAPDVHEHIMPLDALDDPRDDLRGAVHVLLVDDAALCLTQPLHDDLLRRLCGNASEVCRRHLDLDHVADHIVRIDGSGLCKSNLRDIALHLIHHRLDGENMECARLT